LLLEDRDEDVELTLRAFKKARILNEVVVKRDGIEALEFLEGLANIKGQPKPAPTVILLDINTPRMNGIDLLERIRKLEHLRFVPVVMFTSSNEQRDLVACYERGANSYVQKPVGEFSSLIEYLVKYWATMNSTPAP
jgi:CheY-like chemotaxis protein